MARVSSKKRSFQIKQRHKRKMKLKKLREKYFAAKFKTEKDKILEKARRISPYLTKEEFLKPVKKSPTKEESSD